MKDVINPVNSQAEKAFESPRHKMLQSQISMKGFQIVVGEQE